MTSGKFKTVSIDSITVDRPARQRTSLNEIEELAASIQTVGLINPILCNKDLVLVAGERRYTACISLGWTHIPVQFAEDLPPDVLYLIELEENIKRADLEWKDEVMAVHRYHELRQSTEENWSLTKTGDALGLSQMNITRKLLVAKGLLEGDPLITNADKYSVARGIALRKKEREDADFDDYLNERLTKPKLTEEQRAKVEDAGEILSQPAGPVSNSGPESAPVLPEFDLLDCADFIEWSASYTGKPFNLIHCDFPYGVNAGNHAQGAGDKFGGYEDSPDLYFSLLEAFTSNIDKFAAQSSHIIFWFSMDYYTETLTKLRECDNLKVNAFPLVWYKVDNSGILPDPNRGPRRNYETAFLCSRGDRKIVQATSNVAAVPNTKKIHMSEKPEAMLQHFFRMFVDKTTTLFDPTAGSANALKVARAMGAKSVFGLERDPEFYKNAVRSLMED
jgi:ParB/RepB/Spo0J family partition protein